MRKLLRQRRNENGAAVAVMVALLLLVGVYFMLGSVNLAAVRVDRDRVTNDALVRAKEALIAYAVSDPNRPGELPCPDVNDDGQVTVAADYVGSNCASLIGRLPFITLGLPDLRDDAGERLWYAVSDDFHANGTVPLNSDTAFLAGNTSLSVTRMQSASDLAAIVFSPGAVLRREGAAALQDRGAGALAAANYLDIIAGEDNTDGNRIFVSGPKGETFNDTLMPIYSDDIMRLVERRAARELAQHLREHYDAWQNSTVVGATKGFYPYAIPFVDPSAPAQPGTNGTTSGLPPLTNAPLTWSNASLGCTGNGTPTLDCNTLVVCILVCVTNLSARVDNVATRFVDPPSAANVQVVLGLSLGGSANWTLNRAQRRLDFSYGGFVSAGIIHIRVTTPSVSSWVAGWLGANNWHQNAYYAFSPGYAVDGVDSCGGAAPSCLTISNTAAPNNDKQAVVVMTGRALAAAGQMARPVTPLPANINQFLEGLNADATPTQFESNARRGAFNDTPIAVRP